jgi:hypothetical protein
VTSFNCLYLILDDWSAQDGYHEKAVLFEDPEQDLKIPFRTLIPGLRGGLSFKLDLQVNFCNESR